MIEKPLVDRPYEERLRQYNPNLFVISVGGKALPWSDREAYTHIMLQRAVESYLEYAFTSKPTFFDRGIPDTLCYARLIGMREETLILNACHQYRYAPLVFLAPDPLCPSRVHP